MRISTIKDERGFAMVTAIVLMALMFGMGLVALRAADSNSHRTREQRVRESTLALDEGVLYAQSLVLATKWPNAVNPYPASCISGTVSDKCPNAATLGGTGDTNFANVDQKANSAWKTKVRDNGGALRNAYNPLQADLAQTTAGIGTCAAPCTYDFNRDNEIWVQAQSTVRGKKRNVVARMRLEQVSESLPRAGVTAGALSVTNSGGHGATPMIDATGSSVLVRCANLSASSCVDAKDGQIVPAPETGAVPNLMDKSQLARFKQRAITDGRYYPGCPTRSATTNQYDLSGEVVWIEGCATPPSLTNQVQTVDCSPPSGMATKCTNAADAPGLLIWHCGRADMSGGFTHRGILYLANNSDGTCDSSLGARGDGKCVGQSVDETRDVLTTNGGFAVWGALAMDGDGCMKIGSNGLQVRFDANVFDSAQSYGTVGLVQNTWRELRPQDA